MPDASPPGNDAPVAPAQLADVEPPPEDHASGAPQTPDAAPAAPQPGNAASQQASVQTEPPPRMRLGTREIDSFVPDSSRAGSFFTNVAQKLGVGKKGITPIGFTSKKPLKDGLNGASTGMHHHFGYDAAPLTDLVNGVASSSTAIGSHSIQRRYQEKVESMRKDDEARLKAALAQAGSPKGKGKERETDLSLPENHILTKRYVLTDPKKSVPKDGDTAGKNTKEPKDKNAERAENAKWEYDRVKLVRIAQDDSHPLSQHARDVLTAMSIAENQHKRRNGALYQTGTSAVGLVASGALIAGSHGAITPLVASGHATNAFKEMLDYKKLFVETRQTLRDEKADEMQRIVDHAFDPKRPAPLPSSPEDAARHIPLHALRDPNTSAPGNGDAYTPQEVAGVFAAQYDNARRRVAGQKTFGGRIARKFVKGANIDDTKAKTHKDAEKDIVIKHIDSIISNAIAQVENEPLEVLAAAEKTPGQTRDQRVKSALDAIHKVPNLSKSHRLMTDAGVSRDQAAIELSVLSDAELKKRANTSTANSVAGPSTGATQTPSLLQQQEKHLSKIANIIGQPQLKPESPGKRIEHVVKEGLKHRS